MVDTSQNLKDAFAGESQANRKYLAFAIKAENEGYPQIAKLFRAVAEAETIHAHYHLRMLGGVKTTRENLQSAIEGETYEFTDMYPDFISKATEEGNKAALRGFHQANEVEKVHAKLYTAALENIDKPATEVTYYICPVCGFTHEGPMTAECPVCGAPAERFFSVG